MREHAETWPPERRPPPTRCPEAQQNPLGVLLVGFAAYVFAGYLSWTQLGEIIQLMWFAHRKTRGLLFNVRALDWLPRHVDDIRAYHARAYPAAVIGV